jgi:dipeptidase D
MKEEIRQLDPPSLWSHFSDINAIPRPSKAEERVIAFMKSFGEGLGLDTQVDKAGNVLIRKPATAGKEGRPVVALQAHLDMVHQKNADTNFDFTSEGIRMKRTGDWVAAEGTTLGADNGIGVAAIMALLSSEDIPHPPLEALFTIDEETGMTGAMALEGGLLQARYLLNLDSEDDRELTIGCAGGIDVTAQGTYPQTGVEKAVSAFEVRIGGLTGGHSGMDIHLGRANANKLINRLLYRASHKFGLRIASIHGGGLRNAIPREAKSIVVIPEQAEAGLRNLVVQMTRQFKDEYAPTDPDLYLALEAVTTPPKVLSESFQMDLIAAIYACPNGIHRMSPSVAGLVQTSNNLAAVQAKEGVYSIQCLTRSAVESEKMDLAYAIKSAVRITGADVTFEGSYPGWTPRPEADIVRIMRDSYSELFGEAPVVNACHAGLECGILGQNYPQMEMISFGPNIRGAHSPDEKVQISSVQKFWKLLLHTLERM